MKMVPPLASLRSAVPPKSRGFAALRGGLPILTVVVGVSLSSCGPSDFDPETLVNSVRILASSADKPYAAPGDTVNLQVLAYDGRQTKPAPMKTYWIPLRCTNPANDAYYGCFAALAGQGKVDAGKIDPANGDLDAGADAGAQGGLDPSQLAGTERDITPFLPSGPNFSVTIPGDAVATHPAVQGASSPYGLVIVFNMACAGHVWTQAIDPSQPQSVPLVCKDDEGNKLTPDDYVLGYTRVYAYEQDSGVTNTNPVLADVRVGGQIIDPHEGFTVGANAGAIDLDVDVPASSQEVTADKDQNGNPINESIYASYFVSVGSVEDQVRILYDSVKGAVDGHNTRFHGGLVPGDGFVWIVVHDNRDGAAWVQIPVHVR